ncbi:MAG: flagellar motor protein MotB [candidate division KSB1 bacterium]|nr:flagellar motor protein MotB [candidate division KSB1 bacterium]
MAEKKQKCDCSGGAPGWMTTFGDLMSLLLTFFILIVSFSSIQEVEFQKAIGSLKGALGVLTSKRSTIMLSPLKNIMMNLNMFAIVRPEMERLKALLESENFKNAVKVEELPNAIKFTLQDQILFDLGKANLKPTVFPVLLEIAKIARKVEGKLRIEGHTDDLPIRTREFPSNWELSSMRAINVLHYFENMGIPSNRLSCVGYADTRPLVPNTSPENRAKNRRVEIYLEIENNTSDWELPLKAFQEKFQLPEASVIRKSQGSENHGGQGERQKKEEGRGGQRK